MSKEALSSPSEEVIQTLHDEGRLILEGLLAVTEKLLDWDNRVTDVVEPFVSVNGQMDKADLAKLYDLYIGLPASDEITAIITVK